MRIFCFEIKYVGTKPSDKKLREAVLKEWLATNSRIKAIKIHRTWTGSGIREAAIYCNDLIKKGYIEEELLNIKWGSYDKSRTR
jgi:ribosomal protein L7/L12